MDQTIQDALFGTFLGFQAGTRQSLPEGLQLEADHALAHQELQRIFLLEKDFMEKVEALDGFIRKQPRYSSLQEFLFDLLMINFFSSDHERYEENYLESPAWQEIEDETLERGTEILNLFLYLKECQEEGIEPSLSDYLDEFLLVEEEEFQDEHEIYEDVINHQILMESSYSEIARVSSQLSEASPMKEVFNPLMGFFLNTEPSLEDLDAFLAQSVHKPVDTAILFAILLYYRSSAHFPIN